MTVIAVNTNSGTFTGTEDDDIFDVFPTMPWAFSGTIDGDAGTDTIRLNSAPNAFPTPFGNLTQILFQPSASATSIERVEFATQAGDWILAQIPYVSTTLSEGPLTLIGGQGRDGLLLMVTGEQPAVMPDISFESWGPNPANPAFTDYVALVGVDSGSHVLTARDNFGSLQVLGGGSGFDVLNGSNNGDVLTVTPGGDQIYGNDGDDLFTLSDPTGSLMFQGGLLDGGNGFDTVNIVGNPFLSDVNFENIERVVLGNGVPNTPFTSVTVEATGRLIRPMFELSGAGSLHIEMTEPGILNASRMTIDPASVDAIRIELVGSAGFDGIHGSDGNDIIDGREGDNALTGGKGDDLLFSNAGRDFIQGGAGIDTVSYEELWGLDHASLTDTKGVTVNLSIKGWQDAGLGGVDFLKSIENVLGSSYDDVLIGDQKSNVLDGSEGNDTLYGGAGGKGDILIGDEGRDVFVFNAVEDSTVDRAGRDTIADFNHADGDIIDLNNIDANALEDGDQAFVLGGSKFTGTAGELIQRAHAKGILVCGDIDGDGIADFAILVNSFGQPLTAADFIL